MVYYCMQCAKEVEVDARLSKIRCPFCGYKVLVKGRGEQMKAIKAR